MTTDTTSGTSTATRGGGGHARTIRDTVSSAVGVTLGLLPHVLHHVGFIAGSALVTGAGGSALFYAIGLLLSLPMLRRLHRRFRAWQAPAVAIVLFSAAFAVSNLLVGPIVSGGADAPSGPPTPTQQPTDDHASHHG